MKKVLGIVVSAACVYGQQASEQFSVHPGKGASVSRLITPAEKRQAIIANLLVVGLVSGGPGTMQLHRMGDDAAVQLMRILGSRPVSDIRLANALGIIRAAFEHPEAIVNPRDRQTSATQLLLEHLLGTVNSEEAHKLVTEVVDFINIQAR